MIAFTRSRVWLSLLAGITAGVFVWTLPPLPDATVRLPHAGSPGFGQPPFMLYGLSSDSRYLVTHGRHDDAKEAPNLFHVWDRARGLHEATIQAKGDRILFSPNESQLAVLEMPDHIMMQPFRIQLYDLPSGRLSKQGEIKGDHVLFSREGTLLYVSDGVLRDLETGIEIRRLSKTIDGYHYTHSVGESAIYRKDNLARIYSWHTGERVASHDLIGNMMNIVGMSRDGRVVDAHGWQPGTGPWSASLFSVLVDASGNVQPASDNKTLGESRALAPDGSRLVKIGWKERPAWLPDWWPGEKSTQTARVVHWPTEKETASFSNVSHAHFSPEGSCLALVRNDYVIDLYAFPFRKPWGLILGATLAVASATWCVGTLWSRWKNRVRATRVKPVLDTPPH